MDHPSDRQALYETHADRIYRICYLLMGNRSDAEDMLHNTFLKAFSRTQPFENLAHEEGWLVITATNECRRSLKYWFHAKRTDLDVHDLPKKNTDTDDTLRELMGLSPRNRQLLYLYYYEGYTTRELSAMLHINESTLRSRLAKARKLLRLQLEEDDHEQRESDPSL